MKKREKNKEKITYVEMSKETEKRGWAVVVCFFLLTIVSLVTKNLLREYRPGVMTPAFEMAKNYFIQILLIVLICICLKEYLQNSGKALRKMGIKSILINIIIGFVIVFGIYFLSYLVEYFFISDAYIVNGDNQGTIDNMSSAFPALTIILSVFCGPFTEEAIFRGVIFNSLRRFKAVTACIVSGVAFGGMHVISSILSGSYSGGQILFLLYFYSLAGIGLGLAYAKHKNIWINILIHMLWNLFVFVK